MASTLPADVLVRLRLTPELAAAYELQATDLGTSLEDLLEARLSQAVHMRDSKPLYFADLDRQELEALLGKNVTSPVEVLRLLRTALSVRVSARPDISVRVDLKPHLLTRLRSRCFGKPFDEFLKLTITEALERYAGLR